jgi:hypothetical protein
MPSAMVFIPFHRPKSIWPRPWTETSENVSQNKSFLLT